MAEVKKQFKALVVIIGVCLLVICSYLVYVKQNVLYISGLSFYQYHIDAVYNGSNQQSTPSPIQLAYWNPEQALKPLPFQIDIEKANGENQQTKNDNQKTNGDNQQTKDENQQANKNRQQTENDNNHKQRDSYAIIHKNRLNTLKQTCDNDRLLKSSVYQKKPKPVYYLSKKYDFAYCKVPKSGSTFWTQTFNVLEYGTQKAEDTYLIKRTNVHSGLSSRFKTSFMDLSLVPSIIVARDPFSRLYSAYVDKVYLLLFPQLAREVRERVSKNGTQTKLNQNLSACALNVSFEDFLRYVILRVRSNGSLNEHFEPISSLCRPCDVNSSWVLKQETFSTDVEYILQDIGVEKKKLKIIYSALHEHRLEYTVPGIVYTSYLKTKEIRSCFNKMMLVERIWTFFQIQGYIKNSISLPKNRFAGGGGYGNVTYVSNVIMESINSNKMTSRESKQQRHDALVNAYKHVNHDVIKSIREIYKVDIEMFGYTDYPPEE